MARLKSGVSAMGLKLGVRHGALIIFKRYKRIWGKLSGIRVRSPRVRDQKGAWPSSFYIGGVWFWAYSGNTGGGIEIRSRSDKWPIVGATR